jgi:uncharacterized membrane protein
MIVRTCKCGNVGLPCGICDWQTSTLQPSQVITTQILNFLFGMAILYMENAFQTYVYYFIGRVWRSYQFKKVKLSLKTPRDTQQSFPEP